MEKSFFKRFVEKEALKDLLGNNKLTYHFFILLLAFSMLITSSFAWFVSNRKTRSNNGGMSLEVDDTSAVYSAYIYDLKTEKGINEYTDGTAVDVTNLDLNQYDTLFRARNKFTPAFSQIKILGNESMPSSGRLHLTIECLTEGVDESVYEYTSNIARFTALIIRNDENSETPPPDVTVSKPKDPNDPDYDPDYDPVDALYRYINSDERYSEVEGYCINAEEESHSKAFLTVTKNEGNYTCEKTTSITISVDYHEYDWYDDNDDGVPETLNVYLYITYDIQLIDYYFDEIFNDEMLDPSSPGIPFANDLKKITISYDKK